MQVQFGFNNYQVIRRNWQIDGDLFGTPYQVMAEIEQSDIDSIRSSFSPRDFNHIDDERLQPGQRFSLWIPPGMPMILTHRGAANAENKDAKVPLSYKAWAATLAKSLLEQWSPPTLALRQQKLKEELMQGLPGLAKKLQW